MKRLNTLMTVFATLIMATLPVSYAMAQGSQLPYSPSDEAMMELGSKSLPASAKLGGATGSRFIVQTPARRLKL